MFVGLFEGISDGSFEGIPDGIAVGAYEGKVDSPILGADDCTTVGANDCTTVGASEAEGFEDIEGDSLGLSGMMKALITDSPISVDSHFAGLSV